LSDDHLLVPAMNGVVRSRGGDDRSSFAAACRRALSKIMSSGLIASRRGFESGVHRVGAGYWISEAVAE
jgi:hypothetical protein